MNKKLIALAVAGALSAPMVASAADGVTLFGRVGVEMGNIRIDQAGPNGYRQDSISDNVGASRWGLLITEELGGGLKANARVEYGFRTGNGVVDNVREQWVGLSGQNWGALQFGRVQAPFKDFAGGGTIDPFLTTNLQARGLGGAMYAPANGMGAGAFVDHAIRYNSPSWGGFSMAFLASPTDATQTDPTAITTGTAQANGGNIGGKGGKNNYQLGLKFKIGSAGEIFGGYSIDDANDFQSATILNGKRGDDERVARLGTAWNFGAFRIAAQYDYIENALAGNGGTTCSGGAAGSGNEGAPNTTTQCNTAMNANGDGNIWFVTTQYKIGKATLVLQGGKTDADSVGGGGRLLAQARQSTNMTAGAIYSLSKRTRLFGGYQIVKVDGARDVAGLSTSATFPATPLAQPVALLATQPDRETWTIGMRHDF